MQRSTQPGKHGKDFIKAFQNDCGYQRRGQYFEQIKNNVLPFYKKEQILVSIQERLVLNVLLEMNRVFDFLEIPAFEANVLKVSHNKRDQSINGYRVWATDYEPIKSKHYVEVMNFYKEHNRRLFEFLGYEIEEWSKSTLLTG